MDGINEAVAAELERLKAETESEFAAVASPLLHESSWRWTFASGNLNGRYARIEVKPGRGIAGAVLRTHRAVVLDRHVHAADLRKEDAPLFAAEHLVAAAAAPLDLADGQIGVLLLASRSPRQYDDGTLKRIAETAGRLAAILN